MRVSEKQKSKTGNQKTNIAKQYVRDCDQLFIVSRYERNAEIRVVFVYELPARQNKTKKNRNKKKKKCSTNRSSTARKTGPDKSLAGGHTCTE